MLINQLNVDTKSLKQLEDLISTLKKLYLENYLLDDKASGVSLRKQIRAIEFHLKLIYDESIEIMKQRKAISYKLTPFGLSKARVLMSEELKKRCYDSKD